MSNETTVGAQAWALKRCPFCGGLGKHDTMQTGDAVQHYIRCIGCAAEGPWTNGEASAVHMWNQRI